MDPVPANQLEELKREWTGQFVKVTENHSELARFAGLVGRVITVNWNGKVLIDFADGGWYDIAASSTFLEKVPAEAATKYDATMNSAKRFPRARVRSPNLADQKSHPRVRSRRPSAGSRGTPSLPCGPCGRGSCGWSC